MHQGPDQDRPLLMIPGPVEVSPAVREAYAVPPPSHRVPELIESFGRALGMMRRVWRAGEGSQPFVLAGGGTAGMEMAALNLVAAGERAVLVETGFFSRRMAEMLRRAGAHVTVVPAAAGDAPAAGRVAEALAEARRMGPVKALFVTHVDTSTGVLIDPGPLLALAREHGALSVVDGVCSAAGEEFRTAEWGADVFLTASQKALSLPPGLALMVASEAALAAREALPSPPPLYLDWQAWRPIMRAYEEGTPSYFSTPATNLVVALEAGLAEILADGVEARVERHRRAARSLRSAWSALGLTPVPARPELAANTLSALRLPPGIDLRALLDRIKAHGVIVAAGIHPDVEGGYFRVGHMGWTVTRPELLRRTVDAVARALADCGHGPGPGPAVAALEGEPD